jgi:hypothetical protein
MTNQADQPALGSDGQLLDASKIEWFHDPDDPQPIQAAASSKDSESRVREGEHLTFLFDDYY